MKGISNLGLDSFSSQERELLLTSPGDLDRTIRRSNFRQRVLLSIVFACAAIALAFHGWFFPDQPYAIWFLLLFPIPFHLGSAIILSARRAVRVEKARPRLLGRFSVEVINDTARRVAARLGGVEVPNIYIRETREANASATNSRFCNFLPRLNAIHLNSILFRLLDENELKAVLAHELAHFHRYLGPLMRNMWLVAFTAVSSGVGLAYWGFKSFQPLVLVGMGITSLLYPFIVLVLVQSSKRRSRLMETACDAMAAETVGPLEIINALLKIGDQQEVMLAFEAVVLAALEKRKNVDVEAVVRVFQASLPNERISVGRARELAASIVDRYCETGSRLFNAITMVKLRKRRALVKALKVLDWREFDVVPDRRLDALEIDHFVREMLGDGSTATHPVAGESPLTEKGHFHPLTKKRIVYVYLHFLSQHSGGESIEI